MRVRIKKLSEAARLPVRSSAGAAGYDLYALLKEPLRIAPGKTALVPTGLAIEIPEGYAGLVYARSGLAVREGLAPANKVGVIDSDYRGEIIVGIYNQSAQAAEIASGERIAQLIFTAVPPTELELSDELSTSRRGEGGFGSTGKL